AAHRLFTTPIGLNNTTAGVATLYFVVVGMMTVVRPRAREVLGAAAALTVVVLANSRNGIVTAALGFVLMLLLSGMGVAKRIGVAATTVAALVIAVTQEWLTPQFSRLALVGAVSGVDDTWGGRFVAWAFSLELATERPLLGWGLHTIDGSR